MKIHRDIRPLGNRNSHHVAKSPNPARIRTPLRRSVVKAPKTVRLSSNALSFHWFSTRGYRTRRRFFSHVPQSSPQPRDANRTPFLHAFATVLNTCSKVRLEPFPISNRPYPQFTVHRMGPRARIKVLTGSRELTPYQGFTGRRSKKMRPKLFNKHLLFSAEIVSLATGYWSCKVRS